MTMRNSTSDFAFDYTRGNEQNPAAPCGLWNRILNRLDRFTELRAECAITRLQQIDPSLATRIREARVSEDRNEGI